ncbi:MAG: DUF6056 family protein [Bacteroidales bacterium]|nr:DUF6056 family protein [Bacteroidales bacterium]
MKSIFKKSENSIFNLIIIFFGILCITPFFIISVYNYPYLDDFLICNLMRTRDLLSFNQFWYMHTGGRYFYTFLLSLISLCDTHIFFIVKIIPPFIFILLIHSCYKLFNNYINKIDALILTIIFIFIYFINIRHLQNSLFWVSSLLTNLLGIVVFIYFLSYFYKINFQKISKWEYILTLLFIFLIIGFGETMMLVFILVLAFIIIFLNKNNTKPFIVFILLCVLIFSILSVSAPGNFARLNNFSRNKSFDADDIDMFNILIITFKNSFQSAFVNIGLWFKNFYVLLMSVLYLILLHNSYDKIKNNAVFLINPFFTLCLFLLVPAIYYPSFFVFGFVEKRIVDFSYLIFLLIWFYNIAVLFVFIKIRMKAPILLSGALTKIRYLVIFLVFFLLMAFPNHVRTIYGDLFKGRLKEYNKQQEKRHQEILNCSSQVCLVDSFNTTNFPYSIFTAEYLTACPFHPVNLDYARFFYKDSIYIPYPKDGE